MVIINDSCQRMDQQHIPQEGGYRLQPAQQLAQQTASPSRAQLQSRLNRTGRVKRIGAWGVAYWHQGLYYEELVESVEDGGFITRYVKIKAV